MTECLRILKVEMMTFIPRIVTFVLAIMTLTLKIMFLKLIFITLNLVLMSLCWAFIFFLSWQEWASLEKLKGAKESG